MDAQSRAARAGAKRLLVRSAHHGDDLHVYERLWRITRTASVVPGTRDGGGQAMPMRTGDLR